MSVYLRQYGVAATIRFTLRQADSNAFATNSHWTPAAGDVKLSAGGGALADVTNLPTYANGQWSLSLTAGELAANPLAVLIDDAAIIPESFIVETFGDASATYPTSYGDQWLGIAAKINADHGAGSYVDTGPGLTESVFNDALPTNFKDLSITATTGRIQVGTNHDKTGYALTTAEHDAIAVEVESHLLDEGDSQMLINAIVQAIGNENMDELALVAAVRSDLERSGGYLNTLVSRATEARLAKLDITGELANTDNANSFKADVSGLLAKSHFDAALPDNFGVLSIDTSGNVSTTGGGSGGATAQEVWGYSTRTLTGSGALTPTQATQLEETHAKAMLIGDYPQILVDRDPAIGERFCLHKGADYKASLTNALRIVDVGGTVLPAATTQVKIEIGHRVLHHQFVTIDGAVEADGSDLVAVFDVLATDTAGLSPGPCDYSIYELVDGQWRRLDIAGQCQIERGIRGA